MSLETTPRHPGSGVCSPEEGLAVFVSLALDEPKRAHLGGTKDPTISRLSVKKDKPDLVQVPYPGRLRRFLPQR